MNLYPKQDLSTVKHARLPLILLALASMLPAVRPDFSVSGTIQGLEAGAFVELKREDIDRKTSTSEARLRVASGGQFEGDFEGEPGLFTLELPNDHKLALAIADAQRLVLRGEMPVPEKIIVEGSPDTEILHAYETFRKKSLARLVYPPRAALNQATDAGAPAERLAELSQKEVEGYAAHRRELNDFTLDRVGMSIALYATSLRWDPDYRLPELQARVVAFAKAHPDLAITKSMQSRLNRFALTAIGSLGSPLSGRSLNGKAHSLEDFRGQYVLVDFWASWCVPCRVENRHYTQLLKKYSDDNFAIFAINLDDSRAAWSSASQRDRITWPQISDSLGWDSPLAAAYNVNALPMSFLLDPEGRIVARNLRGEALDAKLEEILKQ